MQIRSCLTGLALGCLATAVVVAAPPQAPAGGTPAESPKQSIIRFFGFQGTREERSVATQNDDYVQHNPRFLRMDDITGAKGRRAWVAASEEGQRRNIVLVALNGIRLANPIILIGEGDLVHAVYRGNVADPKTPGQTYEAFAFETFRMRDGKFSEHWDQVRLEPGWMMPRPAAPPAPVLSNALPAPRAAAPAPPLPAPGCSASAAMLAANKQVVDRYLAGTAGRAATLATDFVDRSPRLDDPPPPPGRVRDHVVAECDYVSVVWKQVLPDPDDAARRWEWFTFDAFRLKDGRIVEHWDHDLR